MREDEIDVKAIDWNRVWRAAAQEEHRAGRDERFWDGRASSFAKAASETPYADRLLAIMKPETRLERP